ncbi:MAG: carboxypeptidase M32 [Alphaproteobacteria bacterium]
MTSSSPQKDLPSYRALEDHFRRLSAVDDARAVLQWDLAVTMPPGGAEARAEQLSVLSVISHRLLTDPALGDLLATATTTEVSQLSEWQQANLREMQRLYANAIAVPADLVEALSKACSASEMAWRVARPKADFTSFRPYLERVVALTREAAVVKASHLKLSPYDALLDQYEPGGSSARIDEVFADLAAFLPEFIDRVIAHQSRRPRPQRPAGPFPLAIQQALATQLIQQIGFDFTHGRLDISLHPFSSGVPTDVRITTRYDETDFMGALMGVFHETGHAMYERRRPPAWIGQPVGQARGMALHESQSLLLEMQACRSQAFITWLTPQLQNSFAVPKDGPGVWTAENIYRLYTEVKRSFIRVEADEVTYPAHIILRYRLERAMIAGDLAVAELPAAWNDGMKELLGIAPPDDRLGCLQDIHWPDGAFGYFPTYTLGALAAAQLFDAAVRQIPEIMPGLRQGNFVPLFDWLKKKVHGWGSRFSTDEILEKATGQPLGTTVFKQHIMQRYLTET